MKTTFNVPLVRENALGDGRQLMLSCEKVVSGKAPATKELVQKAEKRTTLLTGLT
jgi:hypothetical protein